MLERAVRCGRRGGHRCPRSWTSTTISSCPTEAIAQIAQDTKDGKCDEYGVRQVELFHNPDGKVYCLLEAPDTDAVRRHHEALGVPLWGCARGEIPSY